MSGQGIPFLVRVVLCTIPDLDWGSIVNSSVSEVDAFGGPVQLESELSGSDPLLVRVVGAASPDLELVAVCFYAVRKIETLRT